MTALQALLAERSVTRAARRCGLTQPSMSHALRRLRALFDDPILVRQGGALVPTPLAASLMPRLDSALSDLQLVLAAKQRFDPERSRRRFRIGTSDLFQLAALPRLLNELAQHAPSVDLVIRPHAEPPFEALASAALDVAIGSSVQPRPGVIKAEELVRQHYVCIVRRDHGQVGKRLSLSTYCRLAHVLVADDEAPGLVDRALETMGASRRVAVRIPDYAALGHVVAQTELIATVPALLARTLVETLPIKILSPPLRIRAYGVCLFWHERYDGDPGSRWLRARLSAVARALAR